ncbi:MAG: RNA polymerase sigma factor [Planctomycetota bacterium]
MKSLTNAALVEAFRGEDSTAFAELFRRHRDQVFQVCLRWLGHHHDAEDVTQETFRRFASSIERWDSSRPLEPWLIAIAINRCRSFLLRRRLTRSIGLAATGESESQCGPDDRVADTGEVDEAMIWSVLDQTLEEVPLPHREAFEKIHLRGWNYQQVAEHLGCPSGTVKTWVHRTRLILMSRLRQEVLA